MLCWPRGLSPDLRPGATAGLGLEKTRDGQKPDGDMGGPGNVQGLDKAQLRPVNADSFLLISAGVDGRYGTNDDITNFPLAVE